MDNISEQRYTFPEGMQEDVRDLISRLLQQRPGERLGFASLQELKQHQFFDGTLASHPETIRAMLYHPLQHDAPVTSVCRPNAAV